MQTKSNPMKYFKEYDEYDAVENTVYRVYGGNVTLEGGYVTDSIPEYANPIQLRDDLALSQTEFKNLDGNTVRNLASEVAECIIYTTEEGEILDKDGEPTGHHLEWSTIGAEGEWQGGGNEYKLADRFEDVVEVQSIESVRHESTPGWESYIDAEQKVMESLEPEDCVEPEDVAEPEPEDCVEPEDIAEPEPEDCVEPEDYVEPEDVAEP